MTKRASSEMAVSPDHPIVAFHREVLIVQQWTVIRQAFLAELQDTARHGVTWKEPKKLWRHSQEALGKWILSQIARVQGGKSSQSGDDPAAATLAQQVGFDLFMASLHFFPTEADFRLFKPHGGSYDEQLIRDLSIKSCGGDTDPAVMAKLQQLVADFNLERRSHEAHVAVEEQLAQALAHVQSTQASSSASASSSSSSLPLAQPRLRRLEKDDPTRTPSQKRVHGPIAEISVQWPVHWSRQQTRNCPPVSLPWAAYQKLTRCYEHCNRSVKGEDASGPHRDEFCGCEENNGGVLPALSAADAFLYRAAVVALRYEGGLATGSLQLCADTTLKQHLHFKGYHLMDLCASPINAYMGVPSKSKFLDHEMKKEGQQLDTGTGRQSSLDLEQETPNFFCSAFLDTDRYFGSLGSALRVDPIALYRSSHVNPAGKPLLLTLDVPYDEDLCEMLFQKLIIDMGRAERKTTMVAVDYVLVLPLWWSVPMKIPKHLFSDDAIVTTAAADGSEGKSAAVLRVVEERSAMLKEGYQVPYHWPEDLAAAAGDATTTSPDQQQPQPWICFDGLFVGNSGYAYFCTATNRWLQGVTATEVIGLAQPRPSSLSSLSSSTSDAAGHTLLRDALTEYYL